MGVQQPVTAIPDVDVLIVGAGISGIGMAAHMKMLCPDHSFAIVERRAQIGGTWDLFRYPGVRSDSDMHTLGFEFEPWKHEKSIADGPAILDYLNRIADERDIRRHIRFDSKVLTADFDSGSGMWIVALEDANGQRYQTTARWLYLGSGYYDYDKPFEAEFKGREDFRGEIVHPQFWPENFDYSGKRVVVIGSGATAVTIVPSMANTAAHVTMLQRTPTWYGIRPAKDAIANFLRKILPEKLAYRITRFKNVRIQNLVFKRARTNPQQVKDFLTTRIKKELGEKYDAKTFTPPYDPWDQRLCLVPDGDLFKAICAGKASIVTDHIERFDATGIQLKSGTHLDADVIITATGLKMVMAGKIALSTDGVPLDFADLYYYKGVMFSNVPNLAAVFGYLNASWTLRADINARFTCNLLNKMKADGMQIAVPKLAPNHHLDQDDIYDFSSGYIERARHLLPKSATDMRWRLNQDYVRDKAWMQSDPLDDGVLQFSHPRGALRPTDQLAEAQ